ncbi:MAG TPA: hypothetical protein VFA04_03040 [Bryobacteraceae bacterium]|nr:hypothetical protein [Bryobacteraceae bacterium]
MKARRAIVWTIRIGGALFVADLIADRRGFTLLDPRFFIPFSCLSALLVVRTASMRRTVLEACAAPFVILTLALALLNAAAPPGIWAFPGPLLLLESIATGVAAALGAALLTRSLLHRVPARIVRWGFRAAALASLLIWRYGRF